MFSNSLTRQQNLKRHKPLLARVSEDGGAFLPGMSEEGQPRGKARNDIEDSGVGEPAVVSQVKLLERPAVMPALHFPCQHHARAEEDPLRVRFARLFEELRERCDAFPRTLDRGVEPAVADGQTDLITGLERNAALFARILVADEKRDEEREYDSENVGIHGGEGCVCVCVMCSRERLKLSRRKRRECCVGENDAENGVGVSVANEFPNLVWLKCFQICFVVNLSLFFFFRIFVGWFSLD